MPNTRFVVSSANRMTNPATVILAGGSSPPRVENPLYPMENMLVADRYVIWASGVPPSDPFYVHIDLGAQVTVRALGVLGLRALAGGFRPLFVEFQFRTAAQLYASSTAAYTSLGAVLTTANSLDDSLEITPTGMRYVQVVISSSGSWGTGFSLGKLLIATSVTDLGVVYGQGTEIERLVPAITTRSAAGIPMITRVGAAHNRYSMVFRSINQTMLGQISGLGEATDPFAYMDHLNQTYECLPTERSFSRVHRFLNPNLYDATLAFEALQ